MPIAGSPPRLSDADTAARIFFERAARAELRDRPRCMIPASDGGWRPVTWGRMAERIAWLAAFLIGRGVGADVKVAVLAETRLEWGLAGLAALAARGVLVPVYPTLIGDALAHVLGHSDSRALFLETAEHLRRVLPMRERLALDTLVVMESVDPIELARELGIDPAAAAGIFSLDAAEVLGAAALQRDPDLVRTRLESIRLDDIGSLIYTSGTTGLPKGVPLTHRNVAVSAADWISLQRRRRCSEGDVDLLWLPMSHIFGVGRVLPRQPARLRDLLQRSRAALAHLPEVPPQVFMSVPAYWEKLLQRRSAAGDGDAAGRSFGGSPAAGCASASPAARAWRARSRTLSRAGILIIEGYGLTECSPNLTMNRLDDFDFDSVGKPIPSVQLRLAEDGEILARGANVFAGYYKDPAATAASFDAAGLAAHRRPRAVQRARLPPDHRSQEGDPGHLRGQERAPREHRARFRDDPLITRVVVYGDGRKYLTAIVDIDDTLARERLESVGATSAESGRVHPLVRQWVQERIDTVNQGLARHETIKRFHIADEPLTMESGFLTPSLKVKRARVYERYQAALDALYEP